MVQSSFKVNIIIILMNYLYFTLATYALALQSAKTSLICYVVQTSDSESMRTADNGSLTLLIRKITLMAVLCQYIIIRHDIAINVFGKSNHELTFINFKKVILLAVQYCYP